MTLLPIARTDVFMIYNPYHQKKMPTIKNVCLDRKGRECVSAIEGYALLKSDGTIGRRLTTEY
jgi:hypothetical protein